MARTKITDAGLAGIGDSIQTLRLSHTAVTDGGTSLAAEALGNEKARARNAKNGAGDNQFGVRLGDLRVLAKKIKTDHELAMALPELRRARRNGVRAQRHRSLGQRHGHDQGVQLGQRLGFLQRQRIGFGQSVSAGGSFSSGGKVCIDFGFLGEYCVKLSL